ncbi:hypothetical protein [Pedobacter boryungensis]|uniref:Uncharacterized protein n=1 Tax=Pedobacter boryungensis TaxID=869962 RepID=A0ABX2D9N6_9SPHI|nr:hypothetical protein [Pedobacter boryungensis]NQX30562.1 hypothetical protein [Pedobacter boryungensis]
MVKAFKGYLLLFVIVGVWCAKSSAQHTYNVNGNPKLDLYQDSLVVLSEATFAAKDDLSRFEKNAQFVKKLVTALKVNDSFKYNFDSLKRVSILKSPDNSFRIITWFVPTDQGTYRYYGTIQLGTVNGSLNLIPLADSTPTITDANAITNGKNWYGARYYEMIPVIVNGKQPYFILLGWKGNDQKTTKKVIEVLSFEKNEAIFGKNIFETVKNGALKNRVIFEYNKLNSMTLTVDAKTSMIVFDHLAPYDPKMVNNFEYYGSDLSFDGYKLTWGKLSLVENIELKNDPSPNDDLYGKPVKASTIVTKSIH